MADLAQYVAGSLMDFLSADAGQARRQWLDRKTADAMHYVPPEIRPQLNALAGLTPVAAYGDSVAASRRMMDTGATPYERGQAAGDMAAGVLGIVAPGYIAGKAGAPIANALGEVVMGYSGPARNALSDFGADEFGGMKLWHVAPKKYTGGDLLSLYEQRGDKAYADFAKRWPDGADLAQYHAHRVFAFDDLEEAAKYAKYKRGNLLEINADDLDVRVDNLEIPYGRKQGFPYVEDRIPAEVITILKKYGLAGLAAMAGAGAMQPGQAQAGPATPPAPQQRANGTWGW
jgi:hypothetical protein